MSCFKESCSYKLPTRPSPIHLIFIGDAPSDYDIRENEPLVGPAGWIFNECLKKCGVPRSVIHILNIFEEQIPKNDIQSWKVNKDKEVHEEEPFNYPLPGGGFLCPSKMLQVHEALTTLEEWTAGTSNPIILIPMGAVALWALTGQSGISRQRGTLTSTPYGMAVPTYHPSSCLRGTYVNRIMIQADIKRAFRWLDDPESFSRPRKVVVPETLAEVKDLCAELKACCDPVACDIETASGLVDCIGFAPTPYRAIVFPFAKVSGHKVTGHYWPSSWIFKQVWQEVKGVLESGGGSPTDMDRMMDMLPEPKGVVERMIGRLY